jgi:ketosteroid isomerase-like protein
MEMVSTGEAGVREAIRRILKQINAAWRGGRTDELRQYFHENMVIVSPGFQVRGEGREACVASYQDFINQATVTEYKEGEATVDVWGDTAVATYPWQMAWQMGGQSSRESGHDVFIFIREAGKWLAVWRTLLPLPNPGK